MSHKIKADLTPFGTTSKIEIDEKDVTTLIQRITIAAVAGEPLLVELGLVPREIVEIIGDVEIIRYIGINGEELVSGLEPGAAFDHGISFRKEVAMLLELKPEDASNINQGPMAWYALPAVRAAIEKLKGDVEHWKARAIQAETARSD